MTWIDPRIPHFSGAGELPAEYGRRSPPIAWDDPGTNVVAYAIVLEDVSAPEPRVLWCIFDLPEKLRALPGDVGSAPEVAGGKQARNDLGGIGYGGPAASPGGRRLRLRFYALSKRLDLPAGAPARDVLAAISGNVSQLALEAFGFAGEERVAEPSRAHAA